MGILAWLLLGALAGWLASILMQSDGGLIWDIVLGIIGALIGGFVMNILGQDGVNGFNIYSILVATLGAVILIAIGRAFNRSSGNIRN